MNRATLESESRFSGTSSSSAMAIAYFSCTWQTSSRMPVESTMPRSWNESSSENANRSDSSPNRKLSMTNCRSSSTRGSMGDHAEIVDETIDEQLRGQHADRGNVVLRADRPSSAKLPNEPRHRVGIEDAVAAHLRRRQQVVEISAPAAGEERPAVRRAVRLLRALPHGRGHEIAGDALQEV